MSSLMLVQTDGAELEAEIATTSQPRFSDVGVLLIHPYSVLGGSMHDFVVTEFFRCASIYFFSHCDDLDLLI